MSKPDIDDSWGGFRVVDSMAREVPGKVTITKEELTALYHRLAAEAVVGVKPDGSIMQAIPLGKLKAIMEINHGDKRDMSKKYNGTRECWICYKKYQTYGWIIRHMVQKHGFWLTEHGGLINPEDEPALKDIK